MLGGIYSAELSLAQSFVDNGHEVVGLIDRAHINTNDSVNQTHIRFQYEKIPFVVKINNKEFPNFVKRYNPDIIIHRYYLGRPMQFNNSIAISRKEKKFIIIYEQETNDVETRSCTKGTGDLLLYGHNTSVIRSAVRGRGHTYFYPYGVSSFEKHIPDVQTKDIGIIGRRWTRFENRLENFYMYYRAASKLNLRISVYGDDWRYDAPDDVIVHPTYSIDMAPSIINSHKMIINMESLPSLEGAYSHKLFQAMGCGIPVITNHRTSIEKLFGKCGDNLISVNTEDEAMHWIHKLYSDEEYRKELGQRGYKYIHNRFGWYERLRSILLNDFRFKTYAKRRRLHI